MLCHMVTRDNLCANLKSKFKGLLGILISKSYYDYSKKKKKKDLNLSQTYLCKEDFAHGISKTVFSGIPSSGMTKCSTVFLQRTVPCAKIHN